MAFLRYTTLRLALLIIVGGIAFTLGMRGLPLAIVAFIGSGLASFVILDRQRDELGKSVGGLFQRISARIDADTRKEDLD